MCDFSSAGGEPEGVEALGPPTNEMPVAVPVTSLLGRTGELAVGLIGMHAYTTGVTFDLAVRLRREQPRGVSAHKLSGMIDGYWDNDGAAEVTERLLLGVEYADGRTATNVDTSDFPQEPVRQSAPDRSEEISPRLVSWGSSGGFLTYDQELWLSPLPPAGPLTFVCAWPAFNVPETRTVVDGNAVAAAGARAQVLWPREVGYEEPEAPRMPRVPARGWFARILGHSSKGEP